MSGDAENIERGLDARVRAKSTNVEYTVPPGATRSRAQVVEMLTEMRASYLKIIEEFPFSTSIGYYRDHVAGLNNAIALLDPAAASEVSAPDDVL